MNQKKLVLSCKVLVAISIIAWAIATCCYSSSQITSNFNRSVVNIILILEPVFIAGVFYGIVVRNRTVYILSILLVTINTRLSITESIETFDIIVAVLNVLVLMNLIAIWPTMMGRKTGSKKIK